MSDTGKILSLGLGCAENVFLVLTLSGGSVHHCIRLLTFGIFLPWNSDRRGSLRTRSAELWLRERTRSPVRVRLSQRVSPRCLREDSGAIQPRPHTLLLGYGTLSNICPFFVFQSDSGGAFKGFKGLVAPSGGGGFSGFGACAGSKPLEGLSNGNSVTGASPFSSARATPESKVAFGKSAPLPPLTAV